MTQSAFDNGPNEPSKEFLPTAGFAQIVSIACVGGAGALVFNLFPLVLGSAKDSLGLTDAQLGGLGSAYLVGFGLITVSGIIWVSRVGWRRSLGFGLFLSLPTLVFCSQVTTYAPLVLAFSLLGGAFGILYGLGYPAVAQFAHPERLLGIKLAVEACIGTLLYLVLPSWVVTYGFTATCSAIAIVASALCVMIVFFPEQRAISAESKSSSTSGRGLASIVAGLAALMIHTGGMAGIWAFVERIGATRDFDPTWIGSVLALSTLVGAMGALGAAALGDAGNSHLPHLAAASILLGAIAVWALVHSFFGYVAAVVAFNGAWFFVFPLQQAAMMRASQARNLAVLVPAAAAFGAALGPGIAGALKTSEDFAPIYWLGAFCALCGASTFSWLCGTHRGPTVEARPDGACAMGSKE